MESITFKETFQSFFKYFTLSKEDESIGMVCTDAGYTEIKPGSFYPPNKNVHPDTFITVVEGRILPEFQIIYISKGQGIFATETKTYQVSPGSLLFIFPGMWHQYRPNLETGWDEYWVGFKGDFFSRLLDQKILTDEVIFLQVGHHSNIISAFHQIYNEILISQKPLNQIKVCSSIISLIADILDFRDGKNQPNAHQKIVESTKFLFELNLNKRNEMNIEIIAEQVGISVSLFNEIFKTQTGMTPYQYFINLKINKAKLLLENENMTIKEIAYLLGFEDQGHFSKLFKNKTGTNPSDWRNNRLKT